MKHLKGQSGPPLVTKNEHFLKLCPEGQLGPPVSDKKSVTKNEHFLKLCPEGQLGPPIGDKKVCPLRGEHRWRKARR